MYKMSAYSMNTATNQGAGAQAVATSLADKLFIVPFIADLSVDASGTIGTTRRADVTITNIDALFDVSMGLVDSVKILNAFYIKDSDSNFSKISTDSSSGTIVDVFDPTSAQGVNLRTALFNAVTTSLSRVEDTYEIVGGNVGDKARRGVADYIRFQGYSDTLRDLKQDTLAGLLEASDLNSYTVAIDFSGGAYNMVEKMSAEQGNPLAIPGKYRRAIFTQLPESNLESYVYPDASGSDLAMEDVSGVGFLPLLNKDKIVFVFDVTIGEVTGKSGNYWDEASTGAKMSRVVIDRYPLPLDGAAKTNTLGGIIDVNADASQYADGSLTITRPSVRRIAIRAEMGTGAGGKLAFRLSDGSYVFDPNHEDYRYMVAAGLLMRNNAALVATVDDAPASTPVYTASTSTASAELSTDNLATGPVKVHMSAYTLPTTLAPGIIADFLVINKKGNKNRFVYNKADGKIEYHARTVTTVDDEATLYYVSNGGKSAPVTLKGNASVKQN
jgi:hypothetical protein